LPSRRPRRRARRLRGACWPLPPEAPRVFCIVQPLTLQVQQVICFAFHDSNLLLETCREAKDSKKIVTLFYLD
jgi:hypothetical protein